MIEFLKSIPTAIWSVALGSLITFIGVLISNSNNRKRLEIQLNHDAELKKIERKASIRHDVYLSAAEELVKANSYLGSLAQIDLTETNFAERLQGFFTSSAKLGLVAEQETGKALNELMLAYSALLFNLLAKVAPINEARTEINSINYHYEESQKEIKRILAAMTSRNESGASNQASFEVLDKAFEFHSNRSNELADERDHYLKKINELTSKFAIEIAYEMKAIAILQIPVLVCIRKELDIETDVESFRLQVLSSAERLGKQLDGFIHAMAEND